MCPSRLLSEWMAFFRLEGPAGGRRGDYHAALVAATVANVFRGKGGRPLKPEDFLLRFDGGGRRALSPEEMVRVVEQWNVALGGQDLRDHGDADDQ